MQYYCNCQQLLIYQIKNEQMLGHSQSAERMLSNINKMKQEKQSLMLKIKENISKNVQYFQPTLSKRKPIQKILINRQKSIQIFQKKLTHKLKVDNLQNKKLQQIEYHTIKKKMQLQRKIEQINNRNENRMKELNELKQKIINKIENDLNKNVTKQKKLRLQYDRVKSQEKQLRKQNVQQKKSSFQQWKILQVQKWRLQHMVKSNQEINGKLVQNKNPIANKKQKKQKVQKYIPTQKQFIKLKSPSTIDPKSMGRQYLQQAKLMQREINQQKSKKKMMNINLKVINYGSVMMQRIYRNTSDLSKFNRAINHKQENIQQQPDIIDIMPVSTIKEEKPISKFQFQMPNDLQTERYLKKIKQNLYQIQTKMSKNPQNMIQIQQQLKNIDSSKRSLQQY